MKRKLLPLLSLCLVTVLAVIGCSPASPIAAVTPVAPGVVTPANGDVVSLPSLSQTAEAITDEIAQIPTVPPAPATATPAAISPTTVPPTLDPLPPVPIMEQIPRGQALRIAREEDVAREMTASTAITFDESEPIPLAFEEFFVDFDPWSPDPPVLSDKVLALDGKQVVIQGYMAPPLQLGLDWFMLTGYLLGYCPFHTSAATITPDIALIYVEGPEVDFSYDPLTIVGEIHVGESTDWQTGMVSLIRIYTTGDDVSSAYNQ